MLRKIEISHRSVMFSVFFVVFLWFLYLVRFVIMEFYLAVLIMAILNPIVTRLSRYKIPRSLSVIVVYFVLVAIFGFTIAAIIPPLVDQTASFVSNLPKFLTNLGISSLVSDQIVGQLINQLGALPSSIAKLTVSIFSNILGVFAILVFAYYLLAERGKIDGYLAAFLGSKKQAQASMVLNVLESRLGSWARAQITLMFVVGTLSYVGLSLLRVPFALPLAILAGFLEIVPYIGPVIAAIPAVLIGFGTSLVMGVAVASLAFVVQQLENYVLVPKIMQKSAGVNPIVTLLALAVGFRLAGVIGMFISVPVTITLIVLLKVYMDSRS